MTGYSTTVVPCLYATGAGSAIAARCSDRQRDVVVVGDGVALEHWRGLGELLARRKYAQRSGCNGRNEGNRRTRRRQDDAMLSSCCAAVAHSVGEGFARMHCIARTAPRQQRRSPRLVQSTRTWTCSVGPRVAASVVALLTTARLGRRSKGKARLARRCVAVAQRRRRAGQTAVAACVLGTRADGEADAADTNHAQVHA